MKAQRLISARDALGPRIRPRGHVAACSAPTATCMPASPDYRAASPPAFADWRLAVDGLVPAAAVACRCDQIRRLPRATQITRHDCVEGWSAIGKWTGVPLASAPATAAGLRRARRATSSSIAPTIFGGPPYYESIDLIDAFHPQTILAWGMNDQPPPDRARRAAAPAGRAPARLQAGQIRDARSRRVDSLAASWTGQRRLLGGCRRLPMVRRHLICPRSRTAARDRACGRVFRDSAALRHRRLRRRVDLQCAAGARRDRLPGDSERRAGLQHPGRQPRQLAVRSGGPCPVAAHLAIVLPCRFRSPGLAGGWRSPNAPSSACSPPACSSPG